MNTIIEKIKAEVERRKNTAETLRERNVCIDILDYLDTLQEQPVCEELEEAAKNYFDKNWGEGSWDIRNQVIEDFKAGAEWRNVKDGELMAIVYGEGIKIGMTKQKEQMEERWLKDRDGCFWDGVEEGKKAMREQMMKEAVECKVCHTKLTDAPVVELYAPAGYKVGDKVSIVIVKEEKQ